ncbi:hypothetical protein [Desulforhabdus amnigena]|jgi:hypothetical protein|uniref:DUF1573 domain-containing protein n=1 Tax=Desulforhabdus amnigena TaxID=40218 RepID=A0A9W6D3U8_9BACT|nr:hypothetical protein [Desulforhabdus amnigena]NLJ29013.1 DUF1573 domain-containing protein [Deltaproteobacteria bacterium]GLI33670.1 hypothetical protein DAMNIGENAA_11030 [Desulforhabdus amnigena]
MDRFFKPFFWLLTSLLCIGCAHTEPSTCNLADQQAYLAAVSEVETRGTEGGSSSIEIPEVSHDFGVVDKDGDYVHEFIVKNRGTRVLHIKKVLPG